MHFLGAYRDKSKLLIFVVVFSVAMFLAGILTGHPKTEPPKPSVSAKPAVPGTVLKNDFPLLPDQTQTTLSITNIVVKQNTKPKPTDCSQEPCLALTFDDGPDAVVTPQILGILINNGVVGTFFVVGNFVGSHIGLMHKIVDAGNELGNHSWDHKDFRRLNPSQIIQEVDMTQKVLKDSNLPEPRFFRPPYEFMNTTVQTNVHMPIMLWTVDPKDWREKDPHVLATRVVADSKSGGVVVMHSTKPVTAAALDEIVKSLKPKYKLVTISQLLQLPPDTQGLFFGR